MLSTFYEKMKPKLVNTEKTFNAAALECGGLVLDESLPFTPDFENADYVFHFEKVVAELKCLRDDNVHSSNNIQKVSVLMNEWHDKGAIPSAKLDYQNWNYLPPTLQIKIYDILTKTIKRRITKANRQIRETKANLRLHDYKGLLIIANDGIFSIPPAMFIQSIRMNLNNSYSEIREFIFLTSNIYIKIQSVPQPALLWFSFDMQDGSKIPQVFLDQLGSCWRAAHSKASGAVLMESELDDVEGFWNAQNITKL